MCAKALLVIHHRHSMIPADNPGDRRWLGQSNRYRLAMIFSFTISLLLLLFPF